MSKELLLLVQMMIESLEYFRRKLLSWREELLSGSSETLKNMQEESLAEPDMADRASLEADRALGKASGCRS